MHQYRRSVAEPQQHIHEDITNANSSRLEFRRPPVRTAYEIYVTDLNFEPRWKQFWEFFVSPHISHNGSDQSKLIGFEVPRQIWSTANRIRTGYARCADMLYKGNTMPSALCDYVDPRQIRAHIVQLCPNKAFPGDVEDFFFLTPFLFGWNKNLDLLWCICVPELNIKEIHGGSPGHICSSKIWKKNPWFLVKR